MIYVEPVATIYNRRPAAARVPVLAAPGVWLRRPAPSPAQFSGTVSVGDPGAAAVRVVQLRLVDGTVLESVRSDAAGAFAMRGWYPVGPAYELHVIGGGYVSRSFPVLDPAPVQWNGNPSINPSTVPP